VRITIIALSLLIILQSTTLGFFINNRMKETHVLKKQLLESKEKYYKKGMKDALYYIEGLKPKIKIENEYISFQEMVYLLNKRLKTEA